MINNNELKAIIVKTLQKTVERHPEVVDMLSDPAYALLVIEELKHYRNIMGNKESFRLKYIPLSLLEMLTKMRGYAKTEEQIDQVFEDVIAFFKQDSDKPRWWHDRIEPHSGNAVYVYQPGDTEITQRDIDKALKVWDKAMPDYKGMLDAKVEVNNA